MPLDHDEVGEKPAAPKALVRTIDRDHEKQSGTALLRQLYNFISTEFEIAVRLARGGNLKQISDELAVSVWTVRTRLHHVFDKTETHRQSRTGPTPARRNPVTTRVAATVNLATKLLLACHFRTEDTRPTMPGTPRTCIRQPADRHLGFDRLG